MRSPEKAVAAASGICPVSAVCRRMMMRGGACAVAIVLLLLGAARCATTPDPVASSSGATTFDRDTTSSGPTTRAPAPDGRGWVTSIVHADAGGTVIASVAYIRSPSGEPTRVTRGSS